VGEERSKLLVPLVRQSNSARDEFWSPPGIERQRIWWKGWLAWIAGRKCLTN
jgi:hypothetical protein